MRAKNIKPKFSISLFMFCTFFALASCKKDKLTGEKSILSGDWKWSYTQHTYGWCEGLAFYEIVLPAQEGNDYSVSFSDRGKVTFLKNGSKETKYRIVFEQFVKLDESSYAFQLKLDDDMTKLIEGVIEPDTLTIKYPFVEDNPNCENYLNFFVRE